MRMSTFVRSVTLAMAVAAAPAQAALVVHDFTVSPTSGPLLGQPLVGRFTYDSSIVPAGGSGLVNSEPGVSPLRSFQLDLGDTRFTAGDVGVTLIFQNGQLSRFRIGETAPGAPVDGSDYFFMDSLFGVGQFRLAGNQTLYSGTLSARQVNPQVDRYAFNVALNEGALAGQTVKGSFAIDHALAQPNALLADPVETRGNLNALLDFDFALNGITYTTANTGVAQLGFDASGRVNAFLIGGQLSLDLHSFTDDFMMYRGPDGHRLFSYTVLDAARHGSGTLSFAPVPEPSTFAMLALGLAVLLRRSRAPAPARG